MYKQVIELDCSPGDPRPDTYIRDVVKKAGLPEGNLDERIIDKSFGNWTWQFDDVDKDRWNLSKESLEDSIKKLYARGLIRYGSW